MITKESKIKIAELKEIIENGEKINVEFKESRNSINKDVFRTVCSFNNRNGGHIVLGVDDDKKVVGVSPESTDKIIKEFTSVINNPNKINPPIYLTPEIVEVEKDARLIYIRVPEGRRVRRCNNLIWDRTYDGNIDITNNEELVYRLYARKQGSFYVNKVYSGVGIDFLDLDLIRRVQKMAAVRTNNHPWATMTEEELLRSSGLILTDMESNKEGLTLAAILLFGKDPSIMSVAQSYKTDAIFRIENVDRYDDRIVVETNLIDSYYLLLEFGQKHLNDIFVLDGVQRVSARDGILREVISNILAHRDYSSKLPARFIIEKERLYTENGNVAYGSGPLALDRFQPFPKNPPISKIFREIGLADELGSGMRNTHKYTKLYSGGVPSFEEGDLFKITIPLSDNAISKAGPKATDVAQDVGQDVGQGVGQDVGQKEGRIESLIIESIKENKKITKREIAKKADVSEKTIERQMSKMSNVRYVGSGYSGHWEIAEDVETEE